MISKEEFQAEIFHCRDIYKTAWSKEYREMEETRLLKTVTSYMKNWMMLGESDGEVLIYPAAGKIIGDYPEDFREKEKIDE